MASLDKKALYALTYGLFVLTAKEGTKDNGCIVNTVQMLTSDPTRVVVFVNKSNYTEQMISRTGVFNVSILQKDTPFALFKQFGFQSGKDVDKFAGRVIIIRKLYEINLYAHIRKFLFKKRFLS